MSTLHTFVADLEDKPGVLNRVTSLFRRRNYNIVSLNVGRTHEPGVSRMTLVVDADPGTARRIEANLYKLVNVLWVQDLTHVPSVRRDLALIKVRCSTERRSEVFTLSEMFRARVVDVSSDCLVLEMTGSSDKLDSLIAALAPFGITELVQSGTVAMARGASEAVDTSARPVAAA